MLIFPNKLPYLQKTGENIERLGFFPCANQYFFTVLRAAVELMQTDCDAGAPPAERSNSSIVACHFKLR